jgi:hypothetical protein
VKCFIYQGGTLLDLGLLVVNNYHCRSIQVTLLCYLSDPFKNGKTDPVTLPLQLVATTQVIDTQRYNHTQRNHKSFEGNDISRVNLNA